MHVRNNIAALRKSRQLSQEQLAEMIGTTLSMLGKLERGQRSLDTNWMAKLSDALDVPPSALICDGDKARPAAPEAIQSISLPVVLPSENALTAMFEGLLATQVDPAPQDERARKLARLLPNALQRAAEFQNSQASVDVGARQAPSADLLAGQKQRRQ